MLTRCSIFSSAENVWRLDYAGTRCEFSEHSLAAERGKKNERERKWGRLVD